MKLLYVILITAFLTGCSVTTPVKRKFPEVPQELQQKCEELKMITGEKGDGKAEALTPAAAAVLLLVSETMFCGMSGSLLAGSLGR